MNPTDVGALRAALISTTRALESAAADAEARGDRQRARWMRQDVEIGEAALLGGGALLKLTRDRMAA